MQHALHHLAAGLVDRHEAQLHARRLRRIALIGADAGDRAFAVDQRQPVGELEREPHPRPRRLRRLGEDEDPVVFDESAVLGDERVDVRAADDDPQHDQRRIGPTGSASRHLP